MFRTRIHDIESAGCGNDFVFDDFKVIGPLLSEQLTSTIPVKAINIEPLLGTTPAVSTIPEPHSVIPPKPTPLKPPVEVLPKPTTVVPPKPRTPIVVQPKPLLVIPSKPSVIVLPKPTMVPPKPKTLAIVAPKPEPSVVVPTKPVKKDTASQIAASADFKKDISIDEVDLGQKMQLNHLYFERSKSDLLVTSLPELNDLVTFMKKYPTVRIRLEGHTDNQGDPKRNLELSENRVKEVKKYLVDQGIDENRIDWIGYGGERPANSNTTEYLRQKNRRVEVVIIGK